MSIILTLMIQKRYMMMHRFVYSCLFLVFSLQLLAQSPKIDDYLIQMFEHKTELPCLVSFHSSETIRVSQSLSKEDKAYQVFSLLSGNANTAQKEVRSYLDKQDKFYKSFTIANALFVKLNIEEVRQLAEYPKVKKIMFDPEVALEEPMDVESDLNRDAEPEWGIVNIQADSVWSLGYEGQDVVVAGQDTGYEWEHEALFRKYKGYDEALDTVDHNFCWHDAIRELNPLHQDTLIDESVNPCGFDSGRPCDDHGHGTHTMGTMVGSDSLNAIGVAPKAKWIACRNMERGYGTPATYLECFEWFLAPTDLNGENPNPSLAPHVINNSWGCPEMEGCNESNWNILEEAVNNLKMAGVVVVASAGNNGSGCGTVINPSAMFESTFSIGATNSVDNIANFSSRGMVSVDSSFRLKPNVTAPGVSVRSSERFNQYGNKSGTSMAGPHVAGTVALMISANPNLAGQVDMIEDILEQTAVMRIDSSECHGNSALEVPNHVYGYGRIDALAAVERAIQISNISSVDPESPFVVFPNPANDVLMLGNESQELVNLSIFSIGGKRIDFIASKQDQIIQIPIEHLSQGSYILEIRTKDTKHFKKFIKLD